MDFNNFTSLVYEIVLIFFLIMGVVCFIIQFLCWVIDKIEDKKKKL